MCLMADTCHSAVSFSTCFVTCQLRAIHAVIHSAFIVHTRVAACRVCGDPFVSYAAYMPLVFRVMCLLRGDALYPPVSCLCHVFSVMYMAFISSDRRIRAAGMCLLRGNIVLSFFVTILPPAAWRRRNTIVFYVSCIWRLMCVDRCHSFVYYVT